MFNENITVLIKNIALLIGGEGPRISAGFRLTLTLFGKPAKKVFY
jgi:hypothetical protein